MNPIFITLNTRWMGWQSYSICMFDNKQTWSLICWTPPVPNNFLHVTHEHDIAWAKLHWWNLDYYRKMMNTWKWSQLCFTIMVNTWTCAPFILLEWTTQGSLPLTLKVSRARCMAYIQGSYKSSSILRFIFSIVMRFC